MNTKIHTTTDYDQFKFLKENRPINQKHVDKLVQSMNPNDKHDQQKWGRVEF